MSNNIVPFDRPTGAPEPEGSWISGEARCQACGHEWVAVAQAPAPWLLCPSCESVKGLFKWPCRPGEGAKIWVCNCGSEAFYITPDAVFCANCAGEQLFPWR